MLGLSECGGIGHGWFLSEVTMASRFGLGRLSMPTLQVCNFEASLSAKFAIYFVRGRAGEKKEVELLIKESLPS